MSSPWLAVGAETDLRAHARDLQRRWERLVAEGALGAELSPEATAGLRPTILESWRRSLATGLDPGHLLAPIEADESEVRERWFEHPLGSLAHLLEAQLRLVAEESRSLVVVTDASGMLLHLVGADELKEGARAMNLVEGAVLSEAGDGTNGIGTPLAADHPIQVFAFEHFNPIHHEWVCSGAPVHDPASGQTVGVIDLSSRWKMAHPRSLELVTIAARTIDRCLLESRREQIARLKVRYGDLMTRSSDLLVDRNGYLLDRDEPRRSTPLEVPEGGGEVVLDDASVAVAEPLGHGEAYLVRRSGPPGAKSARVNSLERVERRARELATEQAALRQIASLVGRESSSEELLAVVAAEGARIFHVPLVTLVRYEEDASVVVGGFAEGAEHPFPRGSRLPLDALDVVASVRNNGRAARVTDYARTGGPAAAVVLPSGMRSAVASPVVVEGRSWGALVIASPRPELPEDTEARLIDFAELVATAIANAESRAALGRLVEEQAALRRVATMVAHGVSPEELFSAVSDEVARLVGGEAAIARFESDGSAMVFVGVTEGIPVLTVGTRWELEGFLAASAVYQTGRPARKDYTGPVDASGKVADALRQMDLACTVAAPIMVEGKVWGVMSVSDNRTPLPPDAEQRLERFTDLVATAIANTEWRAALHELAEEQAALGRVATLVARGVRPETVFSAASEEVGRLFGTEQAAVARFDSDGPSMVVVGVTKGIRVVSIGTRWPLEDFLASTAVFRTGRPARTEKTNYENKSGAIADGLREINVLSSIAAPIVIEGDLWGVMTLTDTHGHLPPDAEQRLGKFTDLVGTAIAMADSRAELAASRARIFAAGDDARRRIERDLHDGAQQRLVTLAVALRRAEAKIPGGLDPLRAEVTRVAEGLTAAVDELRELSRGIHPSILTEGGLSPALKALGRRSAVRVKLDLGVDHRLPDQVEVAAYYTVSEALTNASKHANATRVWVAVHVEDQMLLLSIRDDGAGGADPYRGSGLIGLTDRIEALGGEIHIESPLGSGTSIEVRIPILSSVDR